MNPELSFPVLLQRERHWMATSTPRMLYLHLAFGVVLLFGSQEARRCLKTEKQLGPTTHVGSDLKYMVIRNHHSTPRKEVIHPHLRVGIPCYDLSLIADFRLPRLKRSSSTTDFTALTGGVYKTRERIHRSMLICDYYRFRLHGGEFQPPI